MKSSKFGIFAVLSLALCLAMGTLSGCGNSQEQAAEPDDDANEVVANESPVSITLFDGDVTFLLTLESTEVTDDVCTQTYRVEVTNEGDDVTSWSCDIPFNGAIDLQGGLGCDMEVSDSVLTLSNGQDNGNLAAGESVQDISFQVSGDTNLSIFM